MKLLLLSITVVSSLLMVGVILLQQGKGAGLGSSFGGGARGGLYESGGKGNLLTRTTAILATIFMASSLGLSLFLGSEDGVLQELRQTEESSLEVPAEESVTDEDVSEDSEESGDSAEEIPE